MGTPRYYWAAFFYLLSQTLDAFDGIAARHFNQCELPYVCVCVCECVVFAFVSGRQIEWLLYFIFVTLTYFTYVHTYVRYTTAYTYTYICMQNNAFLPLCCMDLCVSGSKFGAVLDMLTDRLVKVHPTWVVVVLLTHTLSLCILGWQHFVC